MSYIDHINISGGSMKPTIKPHKNMTHHKDGTVSFFNEITQKWERGDVKTYLKERLRLRKEKEGRA